MKDRELQNLKNKIVDYKRFSFIFLFISAFMNIGSALPFDGKTVLRADLVQISSFVFLFISLLFFWGLNKTRKKYNEKV